MHRSVARRAVTALAVVAVIILSAGFLGLTSPARAAGSSPRPPHLVALHPGNPQLRLAPIRVNVVLVGYQPGAIDTGRLISLLPVDGVPIQRYSAYRGFFFAAGEEYQYHYSVRDAGQSFDDAFFTHLAHTGKTGPPDFYQSQYNADVHNSRDVGPTVRFIDAQSTERWLEQNADASLGINPADYTVFLVNWYGRPDFQFHTYTNRSNPDPDTGTDPRTTLAQTHVRAWGGSTGPTWFFDLSAGPVYTDASFDVDTPNFGDGLGIDYRLPPVWDYGHTGYRPFDDLTGDLAKTIRYAAIDTLFAASPLFDPLATQPLPGAGKTIALDIFEGDPSHSGLADVHPAIVQAQHQRLEPYVPISMSVRDLPLGGAAQTAYEIGTLANVTPDCWNAFGSPIVEFYCYFIGNYPTYFPTGTSDSVIPAVGFTVADNPSHRLHFQGITDDDFATGTPSLIETYDDTPLRASVKAYGYTLLATHEAGHFVGLSHPHDGLDPEQHVDYGPYGPYFVAWAGDESDSVMSYLPGNLSFDAFDIDNLARSLYARESLAADYYAGVILSQPPNPAAYRLLAAADGQFNAADEAVRNERWLNAGTDAYTGTLDIERALQILGLLPGGPSAATRASASSRSALPTAPQLRVATVAPAVVAPGTRPCIAQDTCDVAFRGGGH